MDACIDGELFHLCEEDIQNGMLGWGTNGSPKNKKKWMRLCQNAGTTFFYAQSPDFHKPGLCYYPKFLYL